jgi:hypothetical protein
LRNPSSRTTDVHPICDQIGKARGAEKVNSPRGEQRDRFEAAKELWSAESTLGPLERIICDLMEFVSCAS